MHNEMKQFEWGKMLPWLAVGAITGLFLLGGSKKSGLLEWRESR